MELIKFESLDHLNKVTSENANALVIVSRNNCPQCDSLIRALQANDELRNALSGVTVGVAKLEAIPSIATTFGLRQAPSLLFFKDDEEVSRLAGFTSPAPLLKALLDVFAPLAEAA